MSVNSVQIVDNTPKVIADKTAKTTIFLRNLVDAIYARSIPRTPFRTGQLRSDVKRNVLGRRGQIRWAKNYAEYQERGFTRGPIRNYTTPGTGPHFAEDAVKYELNNVDAHLRRAGLK